jgi:FlaA1/EpsC-like NDP-sugar epimerase
MDRLASTLFKHTRLQFAIVALMAVDILSLSLAAVFAALLVREAPLSQLIGSLIQPHEYSIPLVLGVYLIIFAAFRLYRYAWRFASLDVLYSVVMANTLGVVGLVLIQWFVDSAVFPRRMLIVFWLLSILLVGGMRILLRLMNLSRSFGKRTLQAVRHDTRPTRVVILGGGNEGALVLAMLRESTHQVYDVIGFLDDQPQKHGIYIRGVRVLGSFNHLYDLLAAHAIDEVLVAINGISGGRLREYVMACRKQQVPVKVVPGIGEVINGARPRQMEAISVEDLLRRPPVRINLAEIGQYLTGKRVLITGAGGSIGSELCRQILALDPEELIIMGHGENSIHRIQSELLVKFPDMAPRVHGIIGSVSDDVRVDQIMHTFRPEVVFHAAAHKHVPIMEENVPEAVQNNVMGTYCVAQAAGRAGVQRMVLISTDKAVYPSSVMGATKWLCEEVVRACAEQYANTTFVTVRFGNVLGSRGSVVPIFTEQIKRGGPVTITHPEITRYFMTIPEAVQLVLQAGAIGHTGELFLLNMGEPVKIVDLARDMIRLSGYEPDVDIAITFTGLRPGEKLHEVLSSDEESLLPAVCDGMFVLRRKQYFTGQEFREVLRRLRQQANCGDTDALLQVLGDVVPHFADREWPARIPTKLPHPPPGTIALPNA